jgi:type VI secretion system protein ImpK
MIRNDPAARLRQAVAPWLRSWPDRLRRSALAVRLAGRPGAAPDRRPTGSGPLSPASPLLAAAQPMVLLLGRLALLDRPPPLTELRQRVVAGLRRFQSQALAAGLPADTMRTGHAILCAALDDAVTGAPWGRDSAWAAQPLFKTFHTPVGTAGAFPELLDRLLASADRHGEELELATLCLAQRREEGGAAAQAAGAAPRHQPLSELRRLAGQGAKCAAEPPLSPPAVQTHRRPPSRIPPWSLPLWMLASVTAAGLALLYVGLRLALGDLADQVYRQSVALLPEAPPALVHPVPALAAVPLPGPAAAASPAATEPGAEADPRLLPAEEAPLPRQPPPSALPDSPRLKRLEAALREELKSGVLELLTTSEGDTIRINAPALFATNSDTLAKPLRPLIRRIASVLDKESGPVLVVGHTDDRAVRTVRFPSNLALSEARARAVARVLTAHLSRPDRIDIEGRADTQPLVAESGTEARMRNRRLEILLPTRRSER